MLTDATTVQTIGGAIVLVIGGLGLLMVASGLSDGGTSAVWGLLVVVAVLLAVVGNAVS
jgi:hypothetical protein